MSTATTRAPRQSAPARPACEGGTPVRSTPLPFARPELGAEEETAVLEVLRSGWLGTGPRTTEFERAFAATIGAGEAVAVASCTAGLYLALRALGVGDGDEVITSPITFPATVNAILQVGAQPVLAEVDAGTLTLAPAAVAAAVTPRTKAILAVHLGGWPCDMDPLRQLASSRGLLLIEDAAHALGATYRGRAAGALGDAAVFSFYATKNITTGEGGMITTERADCVAQLRRERLHGIDLDASQRLGADYRHWEAVSIGWKFNLNDIASAIGLAQLAKLPAFLARRRELDRRYRRQLGDLAEIRLQQGPAGAETSAHLFPVILERGALRIDRDGVLRALSAENIGVGVHFRALPLHRFFREAVGLRPESVPLACDVSERLVSLPLYPGMTDADQDDVITAVRRIVEHYRTAG